MNIAEIKEKQDNPRFDPKQTFWLAEIALQIAILNGQIERHKENEAWGSAQTSKGETMSEQVMVECNKDQATTIFCEEHDDSEEVGKGFIEGQESIQEHADTYPLHRVVFLKREIV